MPLEEFIIWVYCWTDENMNKVLGHTKLRSRGFQPALSDIEVITMEIIGEFLSYDTDKAIWTYFKTHWLSLFPKLTSRSSFAKQASNLGSPAMNVGIPTPAIATLGRYLA